ncbi:type II toxin-antitoxin system prevent-host-death family antitoxin [Brevundimonas sp. PAMC22021]|nr:type II toxin-antitoxin system prevent-host-death family antitoxin [Brevundimonas sp. PAMC22021]
MQISVTDAKRTLTNLVRRAERGEEIVLTRHGRAAVRLAPAEDRQHRDRRGELLQAVRQSARTKTTCGPEAARSQDFLYDDDGLPR